MAQAHYACHTLVDAYRALKIAIPACDVVSVPTRLS